MISKEQIKVLEKHLYTATEAKESLVSALSSYEELDSAVAGVWDGLGDIKKNLKESLESATDLVNVYQRELNKLKG